MPEWNAGNSTIRTALFLMLYLGSCGDSPSRRMHALICPHGLASQRRLAPLALSITSWRPAQTVGEALHTLRLFFRLLSATVELVIEHDGGDAVWISNTPQSPSDHISDQWTLALIVQRFSQVCDAFEVQEVFLTQPPHVAPDVYETHFAVPTQLGCARSGVLLAPGVWAKRLRSASPALHMTLRTLAERVEVQAFADDPLWTAIRMRLPNAIRQGRGSVEDIAQALGLPLRTLQRRLTERELTFRQLLDMYRQEEAQRLLGQGNISIGEIAYQLGYAEQSAFNRAFKRWTGVTPTTWATQHKRS